MADDYIQKRINAMVNQGFKKVGEVNLGKGQTKYLFEKVEVPKKVECGNTCKYFNQDKIGKMVIKECGLSGEKVLDNEKLICTMEEEKPKVIKKEVNDFNPYEIDMNWSCNRAEQSISNSRTQCYLIKTKGVFEYCDEKDPRNDEIVELIKKFVGKANEIWRNCHE